MKHEWAAILFRLLREFRPNVGFELGTCVGVSGAYHAAAMKLNQTGHLVTFEVHDAKIEIARANFESLGLDNVDIVEGPFQETLEQELVKRAPVDYVFIDGQHEEKATIDYFHMSLPHISDKAVFVFDDINWSDGMKRAWKVIRDHPRTKVAVDLHRIGICLVASPDRAVTPPRREPSASTRE